MTKEDVYDKFATNWYRLGECVGFNNVNITNLARKLEAHFVPRVKGCEITITRKGRTVTFETKGAARLQNCTGVFAAARFAEGAEAIAAMLGMLIDEPPEKPDITLDEWRVIVTVFPECAWVAWGEFGTAWGFRATPNRRVGWQATDGEIVKLPFLRNSYAGDWRESLTARPEGI